MLSYGNLKLVPADAFLIQYYVRHQGGWIGLCEIYFVNI